MYLLKFDTEFQLNLDMIEYGLWDITGFTGIPQHLTAGSKGRVSLYATINGTSGNDTLDGTASADTINGLAGDDIINGLGGNDTIDGGDGADAIDGGDDIDTATYVSSTAGVTVYFDGTAGIGGYAQGDTLANIETILGSNFDDVIYDVVDATSFYGNGGADTYHYMGGADYVHLGTGVDIVHLQSGQDYTGAQFIGGINAADYVNTIRFDANDGAGTFDLTTGSFKFFRNLEFVGDSHGAVDVIFDRDGTFRLNEIKASATRSATETIDITIVSDPTQLITNIDMRNTLYTGLVNGQDTITFSLKTSAVIHGNSLVDFNESFIAQPGRGRNTIYAYGGDDTITGAYGQDNIFAGDGDDTVTAGDTVGSTIRGEAGNDTLNGGVVGDTIYGGDDDDIINGNGGNDTLYAGSGLDVLNGGLGNDNLYSGDGADQLDGGADVDTVYYTDSTSGVTLYLDASQTNTGGFAQGDVLTNIEQYYGSNHADIFYDTTGDDIVYGQSGVDTYYYTGGADYVYFGTGIDIIHLVSGQDYTGAQFIAGVNALDLTNTIRLDANDGLGTFDLTTGRFAYFNQIEFVGNTHGTASFRINPNTDIRGVAEISASASRSATEALDLYFISNAPSTHINFQNTTYNGLIDGVDSITISHTGGGIQRGSSLHDFAENIIAQTGRGNSIIYAYGGDDYIEGSYGGDTIYAGDGDDTVVAGNSRSSTIRGEAGNDTLNGGAVGDTIYGGDDNDIINGNGGADTIYGGSGDDTIYAGAGNDTIYGDDGADEIDGGDGIDFLRYNLSTSGITLTIDGMTAGIGAFAEGDIVTNIETLWASTFDDVITLGETLQTVDLLSGNDYLIFAQGSDGTGMSLNGSTGIDTLAVLLENTFNSFDLSDDVIAGFEFIEFVGDASQGASLRIDTTDLSGIQLIKANSSRTSSTVNLTVVANAPITDLRNLDFDGFVLSGDSLTIDGYLASETIYGTQQDDIKVVVNAADGNDSIFTYGGNDELFGGSGNDTLEAGDGNDILNGDAGNDTLWGQDGDDIINGGFGSDTLIGGAGADSFNGGAGVDTVNYEGSMGAAMVDMGANTASGGDATGDTFQFVENLIGSNFGDTLSGDLGNNSIWGRDGNDTIVGGAGVDRLYGENGDDTIHGGTGNDTLRGDSGADSLFGEAGIDILIGGDDNDTLDGGSENDRLYGNNGDDTLYGGSGNDYLNGGLGVDIINGGDGVDTLNGSSGNDTLNGGDGNDLLVGGNNDDILNGDGGNDRIYGNSGFETINGGIGEDYINGGSGDDILNGGEDNDSIVGSSGLDVMHGDAGDDLLRGGNDSDTLYGDDGADRLFGDAQNDFLFGGSGNDRLYGGGGNDEITAGAGDDFLFGDSGSDRFIFDGSVGVDKVMDFAIGTDLLDISATSLSDFVSVQANMTMAGSWTIIDFGGGSELWLNGINMGDLTSADFDFGP